MGPGPIPKKGCESPDQVFGHCDLNLFLRIMSGALSPILFELGWGSGAYHFESNKVAKIRNRYNQVPHLTQDINGKVTNSQKTPHTRAKRSALSQQVTTKHI